MTPTFARGVIVGALAMPLGSLLVALLAGRSPIYPRG